MTSYRRARYLLVGLSLGMACRQAAEAPKTGEVLKTWSELGLPSAGLERVWPESDEHGFYADYSGGDRARLLAEVSSGLERAGYKQACSALDGLVLGFSNGTRQLALKIDTLGVLSVSLFDAEGMEPLLHGLCFGRYHLGESQSLDRLVVDLAPEQIRILLLALTRRLDEGFTLAQAEQFCSDLAELEADDDLLIESTVRFQGEQLPFAVDAFKTDSELVEIVFLAPPVLADLVENEIRTSFGAVNMRRLSPTSDSAR